MRSTFLSPDLFSGLLCFKRVKQLVGLMECIRNRNCKGRTGLESDFADEHPRCVEEKLDADEAPDEVGQSDDDVAREVDKIVSSMVVDHWFHGGLCRSVDKVRGCEAHSDNSTAKNSNVPGKHVVGMQSDAGEAARPLELEEDYDRVRVQNVAYGSRRPSTIVPPSYPLVPLPTPAVRVQPEIRMALHAVCELAETTAEVLVGHVTVVREIPEIDVRCAPVTLRHAV